MSLTGTVARRLAWRAAQAKMIDEYRRWSDSGESFGAYVERRLPAAASIIDQADAAPLDGLLSRARSMVTPDPVRDAERARERAEQLAAAASAADDVVDDVRRRRDELEQRSDELVVLEHDADERATAIIAEAEREAEERLERARAELEVVERRIELHVADVRWRARAAADAAVHRARREYDEAMSVADAELNRARFAAREAEERAEVARDQAAALDELARRRDDTRPSGGRSPAATQSPERSVRVRHLVAVRSGASGDLDTLSRDELYEIARDLDVAGRSKMSRDELLSAVRRNAS